VDLDFLPRDRAIDEKLFLKETPLKRFKRTLAFQESVKQNNDQGFQF